jgi:anhydro-N-acetylmuramic acid kinase
MYCIGLISGTSVDGIDAALVNITEAGDRLQVDLLSGFTFSYPQLLREKILAVCGGASLSMEEFAALDDAIATQFALAAQRIQKEQPSAQFIGSHGQTVFHRPPSPAGDRQLGYSLQLGRGEVIAKLTGIPTVCNFRAADIAAGGQGAPLVSKVDAYLLSDLNLHRCVQNLGGIGNVTYLPPRQQSQWENSVCGWDTGPANALLDLAIARLTNGKLTYDEDGRWAAQGIPCQELVERWLQQDYFQLSPPKSTGRELFGEAYLESCWQAAQAYSLGDADWLATLTELTVASIAHSYRIFLPKMPEEVLLCGGGSRNGYLKQRLAARLAGETEVLITDDKGLNGDFKEAIAFAVLAYWRLHRSFPGNLPRVTGAKQAMLLGEVHFPVVD